MSFSMTCSAAAINLIFLVCLIASLRPRSADARPRPQRRDVDSSSTICDFFSGECKQYLALYETTQLD